MTYAKLGSEKAKTKKLALTHVNQISGQKWGEAAQGAEKGGGRSFNNVTFLGSPH
jgi:hypothetical protein